MIFEYGKKEMDFLSKKDKKLKEQIEKIGFIKRNINDDIFSSLVNIIIGQQISSKAQKSIYQKIQLGLGEITPSKINNLKKEELQSFGMSFRKAEYIKNAAFNIENKKVDLSSLKDMTNEDVIDELTKLKGIGKWSAEMLLIFSFGRKDILSFDDYGIQKGLKLLYHHKTLDKQKLIRYKKRYSPYATIAGFYLWEIASNEGVF